MNQPALERLRAGGPGCPSGLDLDHLESGELPPEDATRIASHVGGCVRCQAEMMTRKARLSAFPEVNPGPLLAAIQRRVQEDAAVQQKQGLRRRCVKFGMPLLAAAAAVLVVVQFRRGDSPDLPAPGDGIREKGGLLLRVYRFSESQSQRVASGDPFFPGDRLRFVVDVPSPGHVSILGIEASGRMYLSWPVAEAGETLLGAGKAQELLGTVALDNSSGSEMLYLVHCPPAIGRPAVACQSRGAGARPACPEVCALASFVLNKRPRQ